MDRQLPFKIWGPVIVVLVISLSMHQRSYEAITGAAQQLMHQDILAPTRLEIPFGNSIGAVTDDDSNPKHKPKQIDKPLNVVIMYGDDWRHDAIVSINGKKGKEKKYLEYLE